MPYKDLVNKKASDKIYYQKNREKICKRVSEYRLKNIEYIRQQKKTDKYLFFARYKKMLSRCNNINDKSYKDYGGRGIKCLWLSLADFKNDMYGSYTQHIKEFGKKQTMIDRIDNNGNYCKENCRWATRLEQNTNKRDTIIFNGEAATDASRRLGGEIKLVWARIKLLNWSLEKAFTTPSRSRYFVRRKK